MKTFKRLIAVLLVTVMLIGVVPSGVIVSAYVWSDSENITASATYSDGTNKYKSIINRISKQSFKNDSQKENTLKWIKYFMYDSPCKPGTANWEYLNGQTYSKVGDGKYEYNIVGGSGCWAYAAFIMGKCYDKYDWETSKVTLKAAGEKADATRLKELFQAYGTAGEMLRFGGNKDKDGRTLDVHTVVFLCATGKGIYYLESLGDYKDVKLAYSTYNHLSDVFNKRTDVQTVLVNCVNKTNENNLNITIKSDAENCEATTQRHISATFPENIFLRKASYIISTDKDFIKNNDFSLEKNRDKAADEKCYKKFYDKNDSPKKKTSTDYTIKNLKPGTTYYYKIVVKNYGGWHESKMGSFTTMSTEAKLAINTAKQVIPVFGSLFIQSKSLTVAAFGTLVYSVSVYNKSSSSSKAKSLRDVSEDEAVYTSELSATNSTIGIDGSAFTEAGDYEVVVNLVDEDGKIVDTDSVDVEVMDDVTVTFVDTVSGKTIQSYTVPYGEDSPVPADPEQDGYTFKGWSGNYKAVTEDTTVETIYSETAYTVKFTDSLTGKVLSTQKVKLGASAAAPSVTAPAGYTFVGWDRDFSNITEDTTVKTNYEWNNSEYPVVTDITSFTRNSNKDGYDYTVTLTNNTDSVRQGRLVFALMNEDGYIYTTVDSRAFSLSASETRTIEGYVASEEFAYSVDVYTINSWENAGPLASPVSKAASNTTAYGPWVEYTDDSDVPAGAQTKTETGEDVTLYKYKADSYSTSMAGYVVDSSEWVKASSGTIKYVKSWPSAFLKTNSLYTKYNVSPVTASETETAKTVVDSDTVTSYIYWHWCRGTYTDGPTNRLINNGKTSEFSKFHAFESTTKKSNDSDAGATKYSKESACTDSYWWCPDGKGPISVRTQKYTKYKKLYHYISEDWVETTPSEMGITDSSMYETKTVAGTEKKYYRVPLGSTGISYATSTSSQAVGTIRGTVDPEFAGKEATVFIYKYTQPENYTTEYSYVTEIGENGEIQLNNVILREVPSNDENNPTGDFRVAASIEGCTGTTEVVLDDESAAKLTAPKPVYTVNFYDCNGEQVSSVQLEEGGTATAPTSDLLSVPADQKFTGWNQSTVNVKSNLDVYPVTEKKDCVVTIIDWNSQTYEMLELKYGDEIVLPELNKEEYVDSYWITDNVTTEEETLDDGTVKTKYIATGNMVITSNYRDEEIRTVYIEPEFVTRIKELYPELDIDAIGTELANFLENNSIEDLFKGIASEYDDVSYHSLTDEQKLEVIESLVDEEFETYIANYVAEQYAALSEEERNEIIAELNGYFEEFGYTITKKDGQGPVDTPDEGEDDDDTDDDIITDSESDVEYIFYGWKNAVTGELLSDLDLKDDEVYLPVYEYANECELPEADVKTGEYLTDTISVTLTCPTEKSVIWYAISTDMNDFKDPRVDGVGIEYTEGETITISKSSVLTFYATALGMNDSELVSEVYAMNGTGKGTKYNIVTVNNNFVVESAEDITYYQCLVKEGSKLPTDELAVEGYTLDGIYYDSAFEEEFDYENEAVDGDVIDKDDNGICQLYAKYTPYTYTATFYDYDGKLLDTQTVNYSESAEAPTPTRTGYHFTGWDSDDYLSMKADGTFTAQYVSDAEWAVLVLGRYSKTHKVGDEFSLRSKLKVKYNGSNLSLDDYNGEIYWSTDDSDVAEVDYNGRITFLGTGPVTITVTVADTNESVEASFEVSSNDEETVTLSSNSSLALDSEGYIREVSAGDTVDDISSQFVNDELVYTDINGTVLADTDLVGTGTTVSLYDEDGTLLDSRIIIVAGDFDGDGKITVKDASHIQNFYIEKETATLYQQMAIDVNGDGKVNSRDASMVARYTVGKIDF